MRWVRLMPVRPMLSALDTFVDMCDAAGMDAPPALISLKPR